MNLKIIGSSSQGNCYILENGTETLIIEAGVPFMDIKKALDFKLGNVVGCLITHEHGDHCKGAKDLVSAGIPIYASMGTLKGMDLFFKGTFSFSTHHRAKAVTSEKIFTVGNFKIIPFDVKHDAQKPLGFLINHAETGTVLFLTDTYYVEKRFRGLNNVIIECNYSQEILDAKMAAGATPDFLRNRIFKSHMNLATCKETLRANDLKAVNNIVLIHLSDSNSNARQFQQEITACTGKKVYVADAGLVIENFNKNPF